MVTKHHFGILALAFAAYVALFTFVSHLKFASYSYTDIDLAFTIQEFYNTIKFRFLPVSYGDVTIFSKGHISLILFLLAPAYALFPHPFTVLFLQSLSLGAGVFGVYFIAREFLRQDFALYFAFAYLIYPALNYVNLFEAHFIAFSVTPLLFMFYFFIKRRFALFLLFMLLSLSVQEDVASVIVGFSMYVFLIRKNKNISLKWALVPFLCALTWFSLVVLFWMHIPNIAPIYKSLKASGDVEKLSSGYVGFYSWLGNTPFEVLSTLFFKPSYVINHIFAAHKMRYIFELFMPLFFLPLFSLKGLIVILFGMSESLLSIAPPHSDIHFQYPALIIPFIFIAAILGLYNLLRVKLLQEKSRVIFIVFICISLLSAFSIGPFTALYYGITQMINIKNSDYVHIRNFFVKHTPKDVPLITTFTLASHLTGRELLCPFYMFIYTRAMKFIPEAKERYAHALIDFDDRLTFYSNFNDMPWGLKSRCFIFQEGWGLVETVDALAFFQKGYKSDYKLIETAGVIKPEDKAKFDSNLDIALLESKYAIRMIENFPVLDLTAVFAKLKPSGNNYLPVLEIMNKKGEVLKKPLIAPFRIYSFGEWNPDEIVKIRANIFLPEQFRGSDLNVRISLVRLQ